MKLTRGMNLDIRAIDQPAGSWRRAINFALKNPGSLSNDDGFGTFATSTYPADYLPIGRIPSPDGRIVLFSVHEDFPYASPGTTPTLPHQIGYVDRYGTYTRIIRDNILDFNPFFPVTGEATINHKGELLVAYTDDNNSPKLLNIDNLPFTTDASDGLDDTADYALANWFPEADVPSITTVAVKDHSGAIRSGVVQFAIAYDDTSGILTNWLSVSNPVFITDDPSTDGFDNFDGAEPNTVTTKAVELTFENLDTRYSHFKVVAISTIAGVVTAKQFGRFVVPETGTQVVQYTGNETTTTISNDEIIIDKRSYTKVKSFTQLEDTLWAANLEGEQDLSYQPYANSITAKWCYVDDFELENLQNSSKDSAFLFSKTGFMPGEVYAFYIAFLLNDGTYSYAYHIPGRAAQSIDPGGYGSFNENDELTTITGFSTDRDHLEDDNQLNPSGVKYFQTRGTAQADGTMGFWENENETYPSSGSDWDGTLTGPNLTSQKVRHHKFPSISELNDLGFPFITQARDLFRAFMTGTPGDPFFTGITDPSCIGTLTFDSQSVYEGTLSSNGLTFTKAGDTENVEFSWDIKATIFGSGAYTVELRISPSSGTDYTQTISDIFIGSSDNIAFIGSTTINLDAADTVTISITTTSGTINGYCYWDAPVWSARALGDTDGNATTKLLCVSFENIQIPATIVDKVQAYEIFYAERNASNRTVQGQSMVTFGSDYVFNTRNNSSLDGTVACNATQVGVGRTATVNKFRARFHSFDMLRDKPAVEGIYMHNQLILQGTMNVLENVTEGRNDPDWWSGYSGTVDYLTDLTNLAYPDDDNRIRKLDNPRYVPVNTKMPDTLNNYWGEECIEAQINNENSVLSLAIGSYALVSSDAVSLYTYIADLKTYKEDVYRAFTEQTLVSTGQINRIEFVGSYSTGSVYGGDARLSKLSMRLTAPFDNNSSGADYSNYSGENEISLYHGNESVRIVHSYPVYNAANSSLRHKGTSVKEDYYPAALEEEVAEDWLSRSAYESNYLGYNDDYSTINKLNVVFPLPADPDFNNRHPNRIIRTDRGNPEELIESWRRLKPNDYIEVFHNRGEIWNIQGYSDRLIINLERGSAITFGTETIATDAAVATLGVGDLFTHYPKEILPTEEGYGGTQSMMGCGITKMGYIFADAEQGKVFSLTDRIDEISNRGMRNWFRDNLPLQLSKQLSDELSTDIFYDNPHHPALVGVTMAFDERYNRLILSKKDFKIKQSVIDAGNFRGVYEGTTDDYTENQIVTYNGYPVYLSSDSTEPYVTLHIQAPGGEITTFYLKRLDKDSSLVDDLSWTLTYYPGLNEGNGGWLSFHDYTPDLIVNTRDMIISSTQGALYKHNDTTSYSKYYGGTIYRSYIEGVFNSPSAPGQLYKDTTQTGAILFSSLNWVTELTSSTGVAQFQKTFTSLLVYNDYQASGEISLTDLTNIRNPENEWRFNDFRDMIKDRTLPFLDSDYEVDTTNIDTSKAWIDQRRFIDKYITARYIYDNVDQNELHLYEIGASAIKSNR